MPQLCIQLAQNRILVDALFDSTKEFCREYLCESKEVDFTVSITPEDIEYEKRKSAEEDAAMGIPTRPFSDEYLETLAVYRKICDQMPERDAFLFHCSAITVDGKAYLFTASSGTGKSTHTRLWREVFGDRAVMINDDKPLLQVKEHQVFVYGTPWDGKHRLSTNISAPVAGICLLERGAANHIERTEKEEAFPKLLQQTYRPQGPLALIRTLELLDAVASNVPLYMLHCNMEPDAACVAFEGMSEQSV